MTLVTIQTATPFGWYYDSRGCGEYSGFVVDTKLGIILTNRTTSQAPIHARAVFHSGARQAPITPLYIDPAHDFAFYSVDVKYLQGLSPIPLRPDLAQVGLHVCVLGNDLEGSVYFGQDIISSVDCNSPYWDSGINYIQSSACMPQMRSGCPIVSRDGDAVALMSGLSPTTERGLYLPLDLPLRALHSLQSGQLIPRGLSYEEIQYQNGSGLLIAQAILPHGPSDTHIKEADILCTVNDEVVRSLLHFERLIDGAVGSTLKVQVQRHGRILECELQVQDLWTLAPRRLLEYAGAFFQDTHPEIAYDHHIPNEGVVLFESQGSFEFGAYGTKIIRSFNNESTPNLDAFIEVARNIHDQARVSVEYRTLGGDPHSHFESIVIDRHWLRQGMVLRSRQNPDNATWLSTDLGPMPPAPLLPTRALPTMPITKYNPIVQKIIPSMVEVHVWTPYKTNGANKEYFRCMGFVISAEKGFVITAQAYMPSNMCTLHLVFAESTEIPARKVYDHASGFTVIRYDTSLIKGSIRSVTFSQIVPRTQDKMILYGPTARSSCRYSTEMTMTSVGPLTGNYNCRGFYHPINMDVLHFEKSEVGGADILLDQDGGLQGLWLPFFDIYNEIKWVGVPIFLLLSTFEKLQKGSLPQECRILDVELGTLHKKDGLVFETIMNSPGTELICVKKVSYSHHNGLEAGDIIIKRGKHPVAQMSDLYDMFTHESLRLSVIRRHDIIELDVPTIPFSSRQSDIVVWAAGAQFESPYSPIPFCARELYSQVFMTVVGRGSLAELYGLRSHCFVTEVEGVPVATMDDFVEEVKKLPDCKLCCISLADLRGCRTIVTLMLKRRDFKSVKAQQQQDGLHGWHFEAL